MPNNQQKPSLSPIKIKLIQIIICVTFQASV